MKMRIVLTALIVVGFAFVSSQVQAQNYLGSQTCLGCHPDKSDWANTLHPKKIRVIVQSNIIADGDQNGTNDFEDGLTLDGTHGYDTPFGPFANAAVAPMLGFANNEYSITIDANEYVVSHVLGGAGWKQRYVTTIGNSYYILPVQYNLKTDEYVTYHPENWYTFAADGTTVTGALYGAQATPVSMGRQGDSWQKRCMGCHVTGLTTVTTNASGEYLGSVGNGIQELGVGCEACHGPGGDHIANTTADDKKILNPARLDQDRANEVCGGCHNRGKSKPNNTYGYPWQDDTNTPWIPGAGNRVRDFYTDGAGYWPDGWSSKSHHQQWLDFTRGGHNLAGLRCSTCHDPHSNASGDHQLYLPNDDNTACVSCHTEFSTEAATTAHTHHPFDPDGPDATSRCTKCHIPKMAKSAINYDIHSHTFKVPLPSWTLFYQSEGGMLNACATCHSDNEHNEGAVDGDLTKWDEPSDVTIATWADQWVQTWWGAQEPTTASNFSIDFHGASQSVGNEALIKVDAHGGDTGTLFYQFWENTFPPTPGQWNIFKAWGTAPEAKLDTQGFAPGPRVITVWTSDDTSSGGTEVTQTGGVVEIE